MSDALRTIVVGAGPAGLMAAEVLASRGHRVLVYDGAPSPARKFLLAGRGGLNLTHSEPFERFMSRYGAAAERLRPAIERLSPEALRAWSAGLGRIGHDASLVHAFSFAFPPAAAPLTVSVYDLAWRSVPEAFSARGRRFHERALRRVAAQAACAVVPSEAAAQALSEAGVGIGDDRIAVVEAGADHLPPADFTALRDLLARLGVKGDYLLAVGTLEPRKNLARLFSAYAISRRRQAEPLPLVVVGPTGWGEPVAAPEGVVFAGQVAEPLLSALYARARLVAYVPLLEGFGLPVVEAMRAGAPVVASRVPAAAGAAYEVDAWDIESIAAGLIEVGGDEATRARLVAAGRARVTPLTWRAAAEGHLAVWRRVVGGGP